MKRLCAMFVAAMVAFVMMAQTQVTHTVAPGETIQKIADLYHITPQKLVEANPALGTSFKVGMVLVVPGAMPQTNKVADTSSYQGNGNNGNYYYGSSMNNNGKSSYEQYYSGSDDERSKCKFVMEAGVGFIEGGCAYGVTMGAQLNFGNHAYFAPQIGYAYHTCEIDEYYDYMELTAHLLKIPVELGFPIGGKTFSVIPFVGAEALMSMSGSVGGTVLEGDLKAGKFGFTAMGGIRIRMRAFNISASYHHPLNDNMKAFILKDSGYFAATIGFGF